MGKAISHMEQNGGSKMTFYEGDNYKDAVGREWYVVHAVNSPKGERLLLVKREELMADQWAMAIDNRDGTATILEAIGFTTIYDGDEV